MRVPWFICLLAIAVGVARGAERDVVRTFAVEPGCTVAIDTYRGAITVSETDAPEVRIAVHLEIGSDSEAETDRMLKTLQLDFGASSNAISVLARRPAETRALFLWEAKKQIEPTFRVSVPKACNLRLKTTRGSITVGSVIGTVSAAVGTGDAFLRHVTGHAIATTEEGDAVISRCLGDAVARVGHGSARLGTITGRCEVENASGDVEILAAKGDLHVHAAAGTATVGLPRDFAGTAEVSTSGGPIVLKIDPAANGDIDASTSVLNHITCTLPLAIERGGTGRRVCAGRLNAGGHVIRLRAGGGNVMVVPGDSPFE